MWFQTPFLFFSQWITTYMGQCNSCFPVFSCIPKNFISSSLSSFSHPQSDGMKQEGTFDECTNIFYLEMWIRGIFIETWKGVGNGGNESDFFWESSLLLTILARNQWFVHRKWDFYTDMLLHFYLLFYVNFYAQISYFTFLFTRDYFSNLPARTALWTKAGTIKREGERRRNQLLFFHN